ncbi:MAG: aspartate-semialdehyde dehydrogenase [Bdellovibrionales bacterium]
MKMPTKLRVGVVGATGMVGQTFLNLIDERHFPIEELRPFASESSVGKTVTCNKRTWVSQSLKPGCFEGLDVVFIATGDDLSREWSPQAVKSGAFVVDNSAAFRMDPSSFLVVPEINLNLVNKKQPQIIAHPNCTTIQLVMALKPLQDQFGLESVQVSSYQAVSGAGAPGYDELLEQTADFKNPKPTTKTFPHPILFNAIPQIGSFNEQGFSSEEVKVMNETKKILSQPDLKVSAFTVRVPVLNAHSESVWVSLKKTPQKREVVQALSAFPGIKVIDDPKNSQYPLAREASGKDEVFVGRIHQDLDFPNRWLLWVVADNLKKGAALNGIQIAEGIFDIKPRL